jgi:hypothetical protein
VLQKRDAHSVGYSEFLMYNLGRLVALVYIRQPLRHRVGLSAGFASAAAARHALVLDNLAIKVVLGLDNAA